MFQKSTILFIAAFIALILSAGCMQSAQTPAGGLTSSAGTPTVIMTVPVAPVPVLSTNGTNLAYELVLTAPANMTLVPEKVEVIDPSTGNVIYTEDPTLLAVVYHKVKDPLPTEAEMQVGTSDLPVPRISVWFQVSHGAVPDRLTHRLTLNRSAEGLSPLVVTGGDVAVQKNLSPVIIGSPVKGNGWLIMGTTSPLTGHFKTQVTMNGVTRTPERYAQDYVFIDPATGNASFGDDNIARNYYGYGKELYAVGNGTVVAVRDGMPDIEVLSEKPAPTGETAPGNYVILDLGNKKYACYGHMINGSIRVSRGDPVTEGQVLGLLGNTGNSDAPHLHFQVVTDNPVFMGAEGYPVVFRSFNLTGTIDMAKGSATFFNEPLFQENRLMEDEVVVSFP